MCKPSTAAHREQGFPMQCVVPAQRPPDRDRHGGSGHAPARSWPSPQNALRSPRRQARAPARRDRRRPPGSQAVRRPGPATAARQWPRGRPRVSRQPAGHRPARPPAARGLRSSGHRPAPPARALRPTLATASGDERPRPGIRIRRSLAAPVRCGSAQAHACIALELPVRVQRGQGLELALRWRVGGMRRAGVKLETRALAHFFEGCLRVP